MKSNRWIILLGALLLLFIIAYALNKAGLFQYLFAGSGGQGTSDEAVTLSAIVLLGLALVVVLMAVLVIVYKALDLTSKDQALGLPEGSIRALIAFSLVLIFVCLGAFLYHNVNNIDLGGSSGKLTKITQDQLNELQKQFIVAYEPVRDEKTGTQLKDGDKLLYNATYFGKRSKEADDFAKQIFTTLATVFVSVISFYFGTSVMISATKAARDGGSATVRASAPAINNLNPKNLHAGSPDTVLKIAGDGLSSVSKVKFDGVEVKPTNVTNQEVTVTIPAAILASPKTVKVTVANENGESSALDMVVS